jgi:hypothetical protein
MLAARILQVRLRFLIVLAAAFVVVGQWDILANYWDKLTRRTKVAEEGITADTEYWCPMCPGVLSDWPGKCPVCNMALVQRKRGEAVPLPDGVLARMQLSPYRMQLAGIQTSPVAYRPLQYEVLVSGFVDNEGAAGASAGVTADVFEKDLPLLRVGQAVEAAAPALPGRVPFLGKVGALHTRLSGGRPSLQVRLAIDNPERELLPGMLLTARIRITAAEVEPFRSMPRNPPPLGAKESRKVFACPDHPNALHLEQGRCPRDQNELVEQPLAANQRLRWWCPMHPEVTADKPGCECAACAGMKLVPRIITYSPRGEVLALPESALVATGSRRVVYIERGPGMFDGVAVVVGPRCGDSYPVVAGLEAGQRVATAGAFLLDAETRLNPSLAASYFGAAHGSSTVPDASPPSAAPIDPAIAKALSRLPPADQALAARQRVCPVTGQPLGSMGTPARVVIAGKPVLLCCEGCEEPLRKNPGKYLGKAHD